MNREGFLETIRRQYIEDIHEAYQSCIHEGGQVIDYEKLTECLTKLMRTAARDGLPPADFEEMVYSTLPQAQGKVHFEIPAPFVKAA